jgi:hypothetical protein
MQRLSWCPHFKEKPILVLLLVDIFWSFNVFSLSVKYPCIHQNKKEMKFMDHRTYPEMFVTRGNAETLRASTSVVLRTACFCIYPTWRFLWSLSSLVGSWSSRLDMIFLMWQWCTWLCSITFCLRCPGWIFCSSLPCCSEPNTSITNKTILDQSRQIRGMNGRDIAWWS